jgi:hypothetical protein
LAGDGCDQRCVASQAFVHSARLPNKRGNGPEIPAFRTFVSWPDSQFADLEAQIDESLRPWSAEIPVLRRLSAETSVHRRGLGGHPCPCKRPLLQPGRPGQSARAGEGRRSTRPTVRELLRHDLIVIDELGYLPLSQSDGQLLFHLISKLYENASRLITNNLAFAD